MFCLRDMALLLAMLIGDSALSTRNIPMVLDTTVNDIVYEPLAKSDKYLN